MQLARPEWLGLLGVVALVGLRSAFGAARRQREWAAMGLSGRPSRDRSVTWLAAAVFVCLALARPRWGGSERPPSPPGRDVVLALDVSRSMGARDAVPDRLGVAVESAESLVRALGRSPGDRIAVVAFAGRGVRRCPLTETLGAVVETLHDLRPGGVRPGGTDLAAALDAAREAFDDQGHHGGRTVVLFTDGEDHPGHWRPALDRALAEGIVIHTVAVGDPDRGHEVPNGDDGLLEYQGAPVVSRRADGALEAIARGSGGAFIPLGLTTTDLGRLYRTRIEPVAAASHAARLDNQPAERFGLFLLVGLGLALAACWPARPRPFAFRGRQALLLLGVTVLAGSDPPIDPLRMVESGRREFEAGRFDEALSSFRRAIGAYPKLAVPRYDAAATLFRLGRFDEAEPLYREARDLAGPSLRTKVDYAMGNTSLARGDFAAALRHYDDCLASTAPGSDLDRVRQDAAINKRFAEDQARRPLSAPQDDELKDQAPRGPKEKEPDERGAPSPDEKGTQPDPATAGPGAAPDPVGPSGRRGPGGAGGEGPAPPLPGSPEDSLAKAVEEVKQARAGRLDEPDPSEHREDLKDW